MTAPVASARTAKRKRQRAAQRAAEAVRVRPARLSAAAREVDEHFAALAAGELPALDLRPVRSPRSGVATGVDYQVRRDTMHVVPRGEKLSEDVGCTVATLDYRDSREKHKGMGTAPSLATTETGSRRLAIAAESDFGD